MHVLQLSWVSLTRARALSRKETQKCKAFLALPQDYGNKGTRISRLADACTICWGAHRALCEKSVVLHHRQYAGFQMKCVLLHSVPTGGHGFNGFQQQMRTQCKVIPWEESR